MRIITEVAGPARIITCGKERFCYDSRIKSIEAVSGEDGEGDYLARPLQQFTSFLPARKRISGNPPHPP
jgi:hypothetical protein